MPKGKFKTSFLKEENKIYDESINIPIEYQGNEFTIKLYPFFKPEKIDEVIRDFGDFALKCANEKITITPLEEFDILLYFALRHFTDIEFTKSKNVKKVYEEFKQLRNSKIYQELKEFIPDESMESVYDRIREMLKESGKLENKMTKFKNEINNLPLENKELIYKMYGLKDENIEADVNA